MKKLFLSMCLIGIFPLMISAGNTSSRVEPLEGHQKLEFEKEFYDDDGGIIKVHFWVDIEGDTDSKICVYFIKEENLIGAVISDSDLKKIMKSEKHHTTKWLLKKALRVAVHTVGPLATFLAAL